MSGLALSEAQPMAQLSDESVAMSEVLAHTMARRWSEEDTRLLAELRANIGERLQAVPQFQEVVGDRKLLRFLRGHDHNVSKVADMYRKMLDWRRDNGIDNIRQEILLKGETVCSPTFAYLRLPSLGRAQD